MEHRICSWLTACVWRRTSRRYCRPLATGKRGSTRFSSGGRRGSRDIDRSAYARQPLRRHRSRDHRCRCCPMSVRGTRGARHSRRLRFGCRYRDRSQPPICRGWSKCLGGREGVWSGPQVDGPRNTARRHFRLRPSGRNAHGGARGVGGVGKPASAPPRAVARTAMNEVMATCVADLLIPRALSASSSPAPFGHRGARW